MDTYLVNFRKSNLPQRWEDKKMEEIQVAYFKCGKFRYYRNKFLTLTKHKSKQ